MKPRNPLAVSLFVAGAMIVQGQQPGQMSPEDQAVALVQMKMQARESQVFIEQASEEIIHVDAEIERRVESVLDMVTSVTDSTESGRKIANQKEEIMTGLANSLKKYKQEHAKLSADFRENYRRMSPDQVQEDLAAIDGKIEKRVEQILKVSASLGQHDNFKKYDTYSRGNRFSGYYGTGRRKSEDYSHSKRIGSKTTKVNEAIVDGLSGSAKELEDENRRLEARLSKTSNESQRSAIQEKIDANNALISKRVDQRQQVISESGSTPTREVGSKEASSLDRMIGDMVEEIRADVQRVEALQRQLDVERKRYNSLVGRINYMEQ
jgi:hypothetical protein